MHSITWLWQLIFCQNASGVSIVIDIIFSFSVNFNQVQINHQLKNCISFWTSNFLRSGHRYLVSLPLVLRRSHKVVQLCSLASWVQSSMLIQVRYATACLSIKIGFLLHCWVGCSFASFKNKNHKILPRVQVKFDTQPCFLKDYKYIRHIVNPFKHLPYDIKINRRNDIN